MIKGRNRQNKAMPWKSFLQNISSSKTIFLLMATIFIGFVIFRFIAIKTMKSSSDETYLYQFNNDIYGEFSIENNQTVLKNGQNIDIVHGKIQKEGKTILSPYTFVELNLNSIENKKAVYQLLPNKKEHSISLFTRSNWFEIIGGEFSGKEGDSIISLKKGDKPSLMIINSDLDNNLYRANTLKIIALKKGYYYQSIDNKRIEIPFYNGSLKKIRDKDIWYGLDSVEIDDRGYITNGKEIIKISLGSKNKSVLVNLKPKRYNLTKAKTLEVSIVNNNTPSSKMKLVYHKGLEEKKLSYNYIRIAQLLIKHEVSDAKVTIEKHIDNENFLKKELSELIEDIDPESKYLEKYHEKRKNLNPYDAEKLGNELLKYVIEGDYYRVKRVLLMGADVNVLNGDGENLLSVVFSEQKEYLTVPQEMKFTNNRLVIRGNQKAFKWDDYGNSDRYFPIDVPVLYKPLTPRKEHLRVNELNQFLDVTHMNGLWLSIENAEVFYSRVPDSFIQKAIVDYKKSPPLFLYDEDMKGQFVAPSINLKGKFFYKIKTAKNRKISVAFNGKIRVNGEVISENYNSITPFYKRYAINTGNNGEVVLEVDMIERPLLCGVIFESNEKIDSLQYSYGWGNFKKFEIIDKGSKYFYRLEEDSSKPFKKYSLKVKADSSYDLKYFGDDKTYSVGKQIKKFRYSPSLSCLVKEHKKDFLSLYDKDNMLEIIPKDYKEHGLRAKEKEIDIVGDIDKEDKRSQDILSKKLLPIYGDGQRFGLTAKGVKADELTLDAKFSKKVADIFEEVIEPLKSKRHRQEREKYNTILEGSVVVLKDGGQNDLSVVSMYSYPYPNKLDINNTERYNQEIFRYMLMDEFSNAKSSIRNRALDMRIRPGSTFKIVTAITGFKEGVIKLLDSKLKKNIEGRQDINNTKFRNKTRVDMKLKNFSFSNGYTERTRGATFKNSFKYSYNVYFGYLSLLLNHKLDKGFKKELYPISHDKTQKEKEFPLLRVANELQFNKPIYLSKEKKIFAYPSIFPENFVLSKELADAGIGQFEVAVTPMQMAIVANSIRSASVVIPKIIKDEESQVIDDEFIEPRTQKEIQEAMGLVVGDREGTAKCAFYHNRFFNEAISKNKNIKYKKNRVKVPCVKYRRKFKKINPKDLSLLDLKVYGKTGTAEKGKGKLYDGWFIAYTKSKKGDIIVATVVRNSGTGGTYSATITKKVIEAWYGDSLIKKKGK